MIHLLLAMRLPSGSNAATMFLASMVLSVNAVLSSERRRNARISNASLPAGTCVNAVSDSSSSRMTSSMHAM